MFKICICFVFVILFQISKCQQSCPKTCGLVCKLCKAVPEFCPTGFDVACACGKGNQGMMDYSAHDYSGYDYSAHDYSAHDYSGYDYSGSDYWSSDYFSPDYSASWKKGKKGKEKETCDLCCEKGDKKKCKPCKCECCKDKKSCMPEYTCKRHKVGDKYFPEPKTMVPHKKGGPQWSDY